MGRQLSFAPTMRLGTLLALVSLAAGSVPSALAGPIDALGSTPVLGGMQSSTAGPESEPGSEEYVHIRSTDVWDTNSFWYTNRPNLLNQDVPDDWDAMKLINTDRPDFTDVATVVGKGVTQIETGYTYNFENEHGTQVESQSVPESLLRYGTSDRFEWRMKWLGYLDTRTLDVNSGAAYTQTGYSDLTVGFKYIAIKQDNWRPLQTIVTRLGVPLGSTNFSADTIEPGITYLYSWQIRKWWFLRGSTGVDWLRSSDVQFSTPGTSPGVTLASPVFTSGRDSYVQGFQTCSSYLQMSKRLGMFIEFYDLFYRGTTDDRPQYFNDYGLYLYATPNFQLDIRIGYRMNLSKDWFTGAGVSTRF